jgi:F1F0 ATPase subunit 2
MNHLIALLAGVAIGLAFFGGLWVSVRCAVQYSRHRGMIAACGALRWLLAGVSFFLISRAGAGAVLAAFGGFWLTRSMLILRMGQVLRGR